MDEDASMGEKGATIENDDGDKTMKTIKFEGDITHDSVKALFEQIDRVPDGEKIVLYFVSSGGSTADAYMMADYVNRDPKRFEMVIPWECSSAAFTVLVRVRCAIKILNSAFGMTHFIGRTVYMSNLVDPDCLDSFLHRKVTKENEELVEALFMTGIFDEHEMDRIRNADAVYFGPDKMAKLIRALRAIGYKGG